MFRVLLYDSDGCNSMAGWVYDAPSPTSPPPLVFTPVGFPSINTQPTIKEHREQPEKMLVRKKENDVVIIGSTT